MCVCVYNDSNINGTFAPEYKTFLHVDLVVEMSSLTAGFLRPGDVRLAENPQVDA